jgi:hypothetical protein
MNSARARSGFFPEIHSSAEIITPLGHLFLCGKLLLQAAKCQRHRVKMSEIVCFSDNPVFLIN